MVCYILLDSVLPCVSPFLTLLHFLFLDILCGRGGLTNHHKGNKRFRDVVALHRPDYVRAPKIQKPSVARVIVRAIRNGDPPGRFLKKDHKTGLWYDIGDKRAAEKTSQALREKTIDEKGKPDGLASDENQTLVLPNPENGASPDTKANENKIANGEDSDKKDNKADIENEKSREKGNTGANAEAPEEEIGAVEV